MSDTEDVDSARTLSPSSSPAPCFPGDANRCRRDLRLKMAPVQEGENEPHVVSPAVVTIAPSPPGAPAALAGAATERANFAAGGLGEALSSITDARDEEDPEIARTNAGDSGGDPLATEERIGDAIASEATMPPRPGGAPRGFPRPAERDRPLSPNVPRPRRRGDWLRWEDPPRACFDRPGRSQIPYHTLETRFEAVSVSPSALTESDAAQPSATFARLSALGFRKEGGDAMASDDMLQRELSCSAVASSVPIGEGAGGDGAARRRGGVDGARDAEGEESEKKRVAMRSAVG